jgi:hypothetical protein
MELTVAEETIKKHLEYCNNVQQGFYVLDNNEFEFKVGELVHADSFPMNIIGVVFGYVFCPIANQSRAVLGVNCDVSLSDLRRANNIEELTFNTFTEDFKYVESRYTTFSNQKNFNYALRIYIERKCIDR